MENNIKVFITEHPAWVNHNSVLVRKFDCKDFGEVKDFVVEVMNVAEAHNHHPEVTFSYNWVEVKTTTHDEGNVITDKDLKLALAIEKIS